MDSVKSDNNAFFENSYYHFSVHPGWKSLCQEYYFQREIIIVT